jgi:hypothetical protein
MKAFLRSLCIILLFSLVLSACSPALTETGNKTETAEGNKTAETTQTAPETTAPGTLPPTEPLKKNIKNILMIGNSFCYYFVEELAGIAKAAGIEFNVYNLYYSGRMTKAHYTRLTSDKTADYSLYKTNAKDGRKTIYSKNCTIEQALAYENWDIITLQEHFNPVKGDSYTTAKADTMVYAKLLFDYLKTNHPNAGLYWHQTWAYEIGYKINDPTNENRMESLDRQATNHENMKKVCQEVAQTNNVPLIPSGDAWAIARTNPLFGQTLCERYMSGKYTNDHYHDGESGGQYLNACVWFEVLFGKSCIGNTFVPQAGGTLEHPLNAEKIAALQQIAHEAVAAVYGQSYAK